jgi:hypothetical protein
MGFEVGKCYRHTTGKEISVLVEVETTQWGKALVAEANFNSEIIAVGTYIGSSVNWTEISREEWEKNFR